MNTDFRTAPAAAGFARALPARAPVTRCEREGFEGHSITTQRRAGGFERFGFNDRARLRVVRGEGWEVCDDTRHAPRAAAAGRAR